MPSFMINEVDGSKLTIELDKGFSLSQQRQTAEGTSITIEYAGRRIVLRQRARGTIEAEGDHTRKNAKPRTGATALADALAWGVNELHTFVRSGGGEETDCTYTDAAPGIGACTLVQARKLAIERRVWSNTSLSQQDKYKRQLDILMTLHGPDKRIDTLWSQSDVDLHFATRCGTTRDGRRLTPQELAEYGITKAGIRFPEAYCRRNLKPVKPITARNELKDIKVLFGYLKKQSVHGSRFLTINPLEDLDFGNAVRGKRADYHRDRFRWLLAAADIADPTGQLRFLIALAFLTAHRIDAILSLEMAHIGLSQREIRAMIRNVRRTHESEPTASESWAQHFVHGAIYWIKENDKEGFDRVVPISKRVRRELERYLDKRQRVANVSESRWVFPDTRNPENPVLYALVTDLLRVAEEIARPRIAAAGLDPDEIMAATPGDAWHPARGWWEARHAELLWEGNRNSAYVGGWTCNTGTVQSTVYGELHPRLMQACVDGKSLHEAAQEAGLIEEAKSALDPEEPILDGADLELAA